jgi:glucose-1-phosphate thymidylyltransferase
MRIIIPMAGRGKRMRPHTLSIPKPLIKIAGKPIVQRLVEDITALIHEEVEELAFITGDFGSETEKELLAIAEKAGARGKIYYQTEPLGTAHAILCAEKSLSGKVIIAYADTLFRAGFSLDDEKDGIIWVHQVNDPSGFGVVELDKNRCITDFYEKPSAFVSDLAIIGIYYFRDGAYLKKELQYLLDQDIKSGGEYGITDALRNMTAKGTRFYTGAVEEWLDCGNMEACVYTNQRILETKKQKETFIHNTAVIENSLVREPCFIGRNAIIRNAVIGPYVSIGENSLVEDAVVSNSIIQSGSKIRQVNIHNSMIGNYVDLKGRRPIYNVGDYTVINEDHNIS